MNNILPLLASAAVGGVIGYSTNWVAIKMLFRPLEEKRIAGIRLPFTPGVVPRQREALGISIGNAVDDYLFTPEALLETIDTATFRQNTSDFLQLQINHLAAAELTLGEVLHNTGLNIESEDTGRFLVHAVQSLSKEKLNQLLIPLVTQISTLKMEDLETIWKNKLGEPLTYRLTAALNNKFQEIAADQRPLNISLPEELLDYSRNLIVQQATPINIWLTEQCDDAQLRALIETYIVNFLSGNFLGTLLGSFMPPASLTDMICKQLKAELTSDRAIPFIESKLDQIANTVLAMSPTELLSVPPIISVSQTGSLLESMLPWNDPHTAGHTLEEVWPSAAGLTKDLVAILEELFHSIIHDDDRFLALVKPLTAALYNIPLGSIRQLFPGIQIKNMTTIVIRALRSFIDRFGTQLVAALDVQSMVEKQINRLELLQVEEIVLSVMNNQLKSITRFGLLLGALLGLFMPFLNNWLSTL